MRKLKSWGRSISATNVVIFAKSIVDTIKLFSVPFSFIPRCMPPSLTLSEADVLGSQCQCSAEAAASQGVIKGGMMGLGFL